MLQHLQCVRVCTEISLHQTFSISMTATATATTTVRVYIGSNSSNSSNKQQYTPSSSLIDAADQQINIDC